MCPIYLLNDAEKTISLITHPECKVSLKKDWQKIRTYMGKIPFSFLSRISIPYGIIIVKFHVETITTRYVYGTWMSELTLVIIGYYHQPHHGNPKVSAGSGMIDLHVISSIND